MTAAGGGAAVGMSMRRRMDTPRPWLQSTASPRAPGANFTKIWEFFTDGGAPSAIPTRHGAEGGRARGRRGGAAAFGTRLRGAAPRAARSRGEPLRRSRRAPGVRDVRAVHLRRGLARVHHEGAGLPGGAPVTSSPVLGRAFSSGSAAGRRHSFSGRSIRTASFPTRPRSLHDGGHMTTRSIVAALVVALTLMADAPASAQQAKCLAGKTACMAKKAAGLLKCEALAETPGKPADPNDKDCVTKVQTKFGSGLEPAKGCFEKVESKDPNDCPTVDNTGAAETAVDTCVAAIVAAIDPPPRDQTKCGAGKKKCASKYLAALLKCRKLAQTPGKPNDPNTKGCVDKAVAKYTGGLDATKGCFTKLEAKNPNDCQSTTDSPSVKALVEDCVDDLVAVVASPASTTSTTITTTTTMQPVCGPGETFVPSAGGCCLNFHLCGGNRVPLHCCPAGFFCDPGATETCITTPTTTMPTGGQCNPACILPATCVLGVCRAPCGATSCRQANPAVELCCTTSHSNGKCCEYDTPVCS